MLAGGVSSGGRWRSRVRSTSARRSFSFIVFRQLLGKRLHPRLPFGVGENQLDFFFDLFQLLVAEPREADSLLEELQRLVQRQLLGLEALHDFLELLEGFLEIVGAGTGHRRGSGHTLSTPSVCESTVQLRRPFLSCTSIGSPTATTAEARTGLRPRLVREEATGEPAEGAE